MKDKDYIEELIEKNLEWLNDNEPLPGHFKRFETKLKNSSSKEKKLGLNVVWKLAAAAVFVFLLVNQAVIWFSPDNLNSFSAKEEITLSSVSAEYEEVEFYYTNAISGGLARWKKLVSDGYISGEEQQMMETELAEFENVYRKLQDDMALNPNDERVVNAMLEYYQAKLSLINMIVEKLQEVKQLKNRNDETEI